MSTRQKKDAVSKRFWQDDVWARDSYQKLVKKYPDRWVAIANKRVIASGNDLAKVERETKAKIGRNDFPVIFVERSAHVYKN